jgi:hypothetical protein
MTAAGFSRYAVAAVLVGVLAGVSSGGSKQGNVLSQTSVKTRYNPGTDVKT